MKWRACVLVALWAITLAAAGCSDASDEAGSRGPGSNNVAGPSEPPLAGRTPQAGVTSGATAMVRQVGLSLRADQREYARGTPIQLVLRLANVGDLSLTASFATSQRFDVEAVDSNGNVAWRWSDGKVFAQTTGSFQVDPGQVQSFDLSWDQTGSNGQRVPAGTYTLRGWLLYPGPQLKGTTSVVLLP